MANNRTKKDYVIPSIEIISICKEDIMSASPSFWNPDSATTKGLEDVDHALSGWWGA